MMKMKLFFSTALLLCCQAGFAAPFFNIEVNGTTLNITTTVPNRTYPNAGIRLNTPNNFSVNSHNCTLQANGFCTFSANDRSPASLTINGSTKNISVTLCLNGIGALSCQDYRVAITGPLLYATTKYGTVQISENRGASWTPTSQPGGNGSSYLGYISFGLWVYNNIIYMGSLNGNVERSIDNGMAWSATGAQPDGSSVLSVFTNDGMTIYAGTEDGNLAISRNGGATWHLATVPYVDDIAGNVPVTGIFVSGNTIYVATALWINGSSNYYSKVLKSTNNGTDWTDITPSTYQVPTFEPPAKTASYYGLFMSVFVVGNKLYAETSYGHTFIASTTNVSSSTWTADNFGQGTEFAMGIRQLAIKAGSPNTLYASGEDFTFESTDDGLNWSQDAIPPINERNYGIAVNANTGTLYMNTPSGNLFYYDLNAGGSWTPTTQQPGGGLPYGLSIAADGTLYVGSANSQISFSTNQGQSWSYNSPNSGEALATLFENGFLYAANNNGDIYRYNGTNWSQVLIGTGAILSLVSDADGYIYGGITDGGIKYSTPSSSGDTWEDFTSLGENLSSLVAVSSTELYAGTPNGTIKEYSSNGWADLPTPPEDGVAVNGLAVDTSTSPHTLYAGLANGKIKISIDGGNTWITTPSTPDKYGYEVLSVATKAP